MWHEPAAVRERGERLVRAMRRPMLGLGLWVALLAWKWARGGLHEFLLAEMLFLLAPLVLVPLGLPLTFVPVRSGRSSRLFTLAGVLHPIGALGLVPAFVLELPWQAHGARGGGRARSGQVRLMGFR
jgi:hypothetical protein